MDDPETETFEDEGKECVCGLGDEGSKMWVERLRRDSEICFICAPFVANSASAGALNIGGSSAGNVNRSPNIRCARGIASEVAINVEGTRRSAELEERLERRSQTEMAARGAPIAVTRGPCVPSLQPGIHGRLALRQIVSKLR